MLIPDIIKASRFPSSWLTKQAFHAARSKTTFVNQPVSRRIKGILSNTWVELSREVGQVSFED
jgi:hypothetical protein